MPCSPPQRERNQHRHGVRRQAAGRGLSLHPELGRSACATDSSVYFPVRHRSVKGICTDTAAADRRSARRALPLPELVVRPAPLTRVSNALLTTAA